MIAMNDNNPAPPLPPSYLEALRSLSPPPAYLLPDWNSWLPWWWRLAHGSGLDRRNRTVPMRFYRHCGSKPAAPADGL